MHNKFKTKVKDKVIKFQDFDDTEIESADLIKYIKEKQSDNFFLNIFCKQTLNTSGKLVIYKTAIYCNLYNTLEIYFNKFEL